jgi:hypothetical protein
MIIATMPVFPLMLKAQDNCAVLTEAMEHPKPANCTKYISEILPELVGFHEPDTY